jgi:hypothetical protein
MYDKKNMGFWGNGQAMFWENDTNNINNFIVGLLANGNPVLPCYPEKGIYLQECRTIPSLTNYINRWQMRRIEYFNKELQKAIEANDKSEIRDNAEGLTWSPVVWSLEEDNKNEFSFYPEYIYVLKKGTVYVHERHFCFDCPMNEYFIKDLVERRENFVIAACENCIVRVLCTRSIKQKTLCKDAYNEIKEYVNKQLNAS